MVLTGVLVLGFTFENHSGSKPKLLIENTTRDTPMIPVFEETRHMANELIQT